MIVADEIARSLVDYLKKVRGVQQVVVAGSYRRRKETVGDLDILTTCNEPADMMERFVKFEEVKQVLAHGTTRSAVVLRSGVQVDLRVVPPESYGAALLYFTGSKAHNIAVRTLGLKKGLKINEYGVFRADKQIAGRAEEEVYTQVALPYIEPELREARGEIEAAQQHCLPRLIALPDIRGDLHCHTTDSDGRSSLEEMTEAARQHGYEYVAISGPAEGNVRVRIRNCESRACQLIRGGIHVMNHPRSVEIPIWLAQGYVRRTNIWPTKPRA